MSQSLKIALEQWCIQCVSLSGLTGTLPLVNVDSGAIAAQERAIFSATIGEKQLEGAKCYAATVEIELRSTNRDATAVDSVFASIEAAFVYPVSSAVAYAGMLFTELRFFPENMESEASREDNTRRRSRTYPFTVLPQSGAPASHTSDSTLIYADSTLITADAA